MKKGLTRRAALTAVGAMIGSTYGTTVTATRQGRVLLLSLDDVAEIQLRYRGRVASVHPAMVIDALSGKEEQT